MVDREDGRIDMESLAAHGCGNVLVLGVLAAEWMTQNRPAIGRLREAFEAVYYQIDPTEFKADRIDIQRLESMRRYFHEFCRGGAFEVEPVLIPECYYIDRADARSKIILNKIATGAAHEQSDEQYLRSAGELLDKLRPLFDPARWDVDELFRRMCRHTVVIAEGVEAAYRTDTVFMPRYDMTPDEKTKYGDTHTMFLSLLEEGFSKLVPAGKEAEYRERLDKEIYILESTDNVDYLLVQYDTVNWARRNGILVGCGRGSAGGCLALYLLGITLIDPVKYGLLFERFLLPERAGLYEARTTRIVGRIDSQDSYRLGLENGREILLDRDARLMVRRGEKILEVYADELREQDDILFDNRDLLFEIDRQL